MRSLVAAALAAAVAATALPAVAASDADAIWFPVQVTAEVRFDDTWGDARAAGRTHDGVDIVAPQMHEVYAAESGEIAAYRGDCDPGEHCSSYYLLLAADDGRSYFYVHLNNDTPGRPDGCDGLGGIDAAFAPRLVEGLRSAGTLVGLRVGRGEHIAYVGSSGNAPCHAPHLHFEVWTEHGWGAPKVNPTPYAQAAFDAGYYWGPEGSGEAAPVPLRSRRVAGDDRVLTAVELSREGFDTAEAVVIAPAHVYPEALVAAPFAAVLGGPVLLAWEANGRDLLDAAVVDEIERLGAGYAVVVGAPDRLSEQLEEALAERTAIPPDRIVRIAGEDRYDLSRQVAREVLAFHGIALADGDDERAPIVDLLAIARGTPPDDQGDDPGDDQSDDPGDDPGEGEPAEGEVAALSPLLALGEHEIEDRGWPDALAGSVLAARERVPVLLTRSGDLPAATREVLAADGIGEVRIVGGPEAVSEAVETAVRDEVGRATRRLAGADRYGTSLAVAAEVEAGGGAPETLYVATGTNFPDALAAGPSLATLGVVLVLVHGADTTRAEAVYEWLRDRVGEIGTIVAIGGPDAVSRAVLRRVATHANWPR